eukprot:2452130-Karenia_brevis.AAC.2
MEVPRAHGSTDKPTLQDKVLAILCGIVAQGAWGSQRMHQKQLSKSSTGGCPRPCVPHNEK